MKTTLSLVAMAAVTATLVSFQAQAATVNPKSVSATAGINGNDTTVSTPPVAVANRTQTFGNQVVDTVTADAVQNEDGFSSVEVNVKHDGMNAVAASGHLDEITAKARADRTVEYTVDGFAPVIGTFDFNISQVELEVFNGGGGPVVPEAFVFFRAEAKLGQTVLDSYEAYMQLRGDYNDFEIVNSSGFTGTVDRRECFMQFCNRGVVTVDPLSESLSLGQLLPGSVVSISTTLYVDFLGVNGTELGARARARDPNGGMFNTVPVGPNPVPLPAAGWFLIAGLGAMRALRRSRA